ncbi:7-cyano-7-deazaguanine synthase [bacterium]|nr:7-cyano-7-deazaguanine synthase [bacterium]
MSKVLVMLSGGLDSYTAAVLLKRSERLGAALFVDYGQRAATAERAAVRTQAKELEVELYTERLSTYKDLPNTGGLIGEPLEDDATTEQLWVPARNALLYSVGAAHAEARGFSAVALGLNVEEGRDFADNTAGFLEAADRFIFIATAGKVRAEAPTVNLDKAAMIRRLTELGCSLDSIYSCYRDSDRKGQMCGSCPGCKRLKAALAAAELDLSHRFRA